ncbi:hypothetical protein DH2020_046679 [Rehmannia glutinosa]|uniref:PPIase cyclophilin-type domain-containing protein n=1 Tax=Rehmannia glutinosa TaxID=99300 RepID=A0ABR0UB87_REHGL
MSTVYVLEPPTKGKVIVTTSYGPLDIELWPKEAPKAVRNFVQLCLEGYYNDTVFHRVIKSFLVQGGDPTGTGEGGESIYGGAFPDEFHSRLRFKHRGLVACAGASTPNSNGSQFFITLDRCDWLDKKHTIFGKVTGDSIFNLLQLGEVETGKDDRPLEPLPKILSVEVLWNPFDDIVPRVVPAKSLPSSGKKETKQKVTKKLNLLSFGEEAEEEEKELSAANTRIRSSHDVLNDPRLPKEGPENDLAKNKGCAILVREALSSKKEQRKEFEWIFESLDNSDEDEASFDLRMRPLEARAERMANADTDLQLLGEAERERQLKKQKKRRRQGHEDDVLAKLEKFKSAFSTKSKGSNDEHAGDKDDDMSDWMGVELKFAREPGKNNMSRSDDPNDYVVHDPLLEKGKEKFNRMQAKEKRRQREWAGKSLT